MDEYEAMKALDKIVERYDATAHLDDRDTGRIGFGEVVAAARRWVLLTDKAAQRLDRDLDAALKVLAYQVEDAMNERSLGHAVYPKNLGDAAAQAVDAASRARGYMEAAIGSAITSSRSIAQTRAEEVTGEL